MDLEIDDSVAFFFVPVCTPKSSSSLRGLRVPLISRSELRNTEEVVLSGEQNINYRNE
jgi:hypothetical protein